MSKLTKNERIAELERKVEALEKQSSYVDNMLTELNHALPDPEYDAKCEASEADIDESLDRHRERLGLNKPQLKQLDQSVFDGLSNELRFASVDDDGRGFAFDVKPELMSCEWDVPCNKICQFIDEGYDTSNWQNSLIERDITKELTGSDLCRAMLLDTKKPVMCKTLKGFDLISSFRTDGDKYLFHGKQQGEYSVVIPINNQGEPLTASEVGL